MRTFQNVVDLARIPLNDDDKTRFADAQLLKYANVAVQLLRSARPDLFFGVTLPANEYSLTDPIPLPDSYEQPLADYVTARAEWRNDSASVQERAAAFFQLFSGAT
jgi:hypothetical protein